MSRLQAIRHPIGESKGSYFLLCPAEKLVLLTLGNVLTINDVVEYARELQNNPFFEPGFSEIADIRAVEEVALGADDMMKMADEIDPFSPEAKRAFVVRTPTQAHAARMHKILRTQRDFEIFRSVDAARRWINA